MELLEPIQGLRKQVLNGWDKQAADNARVQVVVTDLLLLIANLSWLLLCNNKIYKEGPLCHSY